jgi:hypothetical protein
MSNVTTFLIHIKEIIYCIDSSQSKSTSIFACICCCQPKHMKEQNNWGQIWIYFFFFSIFRVQITGSMYSIYSSMKSAACYFSLKNKNIHVQGVFSPIYRPHLLMPLCFPASSTYCRLFSYYNDVDLFWVDSFLGTIRSSYLSADICSYPMYLHKPQYLDQIILNFNWKIVTSHFYEK